MANYWENSHTDLRIISVVFERVFHAKINDYLLDIQR